MQEFLNQTLEQLRGMWRFRKAALIAAWVVCALGWVVVLVLPPTYQATARVYIDTSAVLRPLLQGIAVEQDLDAQINFVRQALVSRPKLEKIARETELDLKADTPEEKEELINSLGERVKIEAYGENEKRSSRAPKGATSTLFTISFEDSKRPKALKVVQLIVNTFVEDTLGGKLSGADSAQRFLRGQIDDYEKRLRASEDQLAEFKRKNVGLVPGQGGQNDYFSRLQMETQNLERAQASLRIAVQRRDELQRQLRGDMSHVGGVSSGSSSSGAAAAAGGDLSLRIAETERQLDSLLLRYTDKHPEVIATRQILDDLKARQQSEIEALKRGQASTQTMAGLGASPVYQQIQSQLNQANVEVVSLQSQVGLAQQQVNKLQGMLDTAPEVEAEFARLTRDYEVTRAQYNELLARFERAKISEEAEQTGVIKFDVIDPPNVALEPVAPDRPRLLFLVLALGLASGLGLAFVLHQLSPVFNDTKLLGEATGLPVLGAVSRIWRERHRLERRAELRRFSAVSAGLVAAFVVVLLIQGFAVRAIQHVIG